jgi:hypothetical protein
VRIVTFSCRYLPCELAAMVVRVGFMVDQMILGLIFLPVCSNVIIIPPMTIHDIWTIGGRIDGVTPTPKSKILKLLYFEGSYHRTSSALHASMWVALCVFSSCTAGHTFVL